MKRFVLGLAIICLLPIAAYKMRTVGAQAQAGQFSGTPQPRPVGSTAVFAGEVTTGQNCGNITRCIGPHPGTTGTPVAGITIAAGNPGDAVGVMMNGVAACVFDNQPVQGDVVMTAAGGFCHDGGNTGQFVIPNNASIVGSVTSVMDATDAYVTLIGPATFGKMVVAATMGPDMAAYVQSVQNQQVQSDWLATSGLGAILNKPLIPAAQVNSDWNATSGLAQILNKPTITSGTLTSVTGNAPIVSSGGNAPIISCPTCVVRLTGTTGSIGGSLLALGACATGTAAVAGSTPGMLFAVGRSDGAFIGGGYTLRADVITAGTVTVNLCATVAGTPPSGKTFNVSY